MKAKFRLYWQVTKEVVNEVISFLVFFLALGVLGLLEVVAFVFYFGYAYDPLVELLVSAGALSWPRIFRGLLEMMTDVVLPFAVAIGTVFLCILLFVGVLEVMKRIRSLCFRSPPSCLSV